MFTGNNSTSSNESLWEEIWLENTPGNQDMLLFSIVLGRCEYKCILTELLLKKQV